MNQTELSTWIGVNFLNNPLLHSMAGIEDFGGSTLQWLQANQQIVNSLNVFPVPMATQAPTCC